MGIITVDFDATGQLRITYILHSSNPWGGNKRKYNEAVHQLFMNFKQVHDSVKKEVLYNMHTEFDIPMKLVRLIKMCPNETHSRV